MLLTILLWILKIIGILLLAAVGLILLLVCVILFVPVRYEASGDSFGPFYIRAKLSWLLHIFTVRVSYENSEVDFKIKIFGIPVSRGEKKEKPVKKRKIRKKEHDEYVKAEYEEESTEDTSQISLPNEGLANESTEDASLMTETMPLTDTSPQEKYEEPAPVIEEATEQKEKSGKFKTFIQKVKQFVESLIHGLQNIKYTIIHICDKINKIRENVNRYYEIITSDYAKNSFSLCKTQLAKTLRHIRPRKFSAEVHFGTGDPASTGEVIGMYSLLYPSIGRHIRVTPDFDNAVFEGKFHFKGRVRAIVLVCVAWKLYFDKDLKKLIQVLRKDDENDG